MEEKGIHYRVGGKLTHCGCEVLPNGQDIERIVIERIEYKETEKINGRVETNVWVAHFAPDNGYTSLPFVLNSTNRKRIAKLYPDCNGYINLLKNVPVRLTRERCRDVQDGGDTWGLRISKEPAAEVIRKRITMEQVSKLAARAKETGRTFEEILSVCDMDADVAQTLKEALNG